jgi:hypothetical protein
MSHHFLIAAFVAVIVIQSAYLIRLAVGFAKLR